MGIVRVRPRLSSSSWSWAKRALRRLRTLNAVDFPPAQIHKVFALLTPGSDIPDACWRCLQGTQLHRLRRWEIRPHPIIGGSCYKYHFRRDKSIVTTKHVFCREQKYTCRDKHNFVSTSLLLSQQNTSFVATKVCLSRQARVCRDKTCGSSRQW